MGIRKIFIEPGSRFGNLVFIKEFNEVKYYNLKPRSVWLALCICDCGNEKITRMATLIDKDCTSCGCLYKKVNSESGTKLYWRWNAMKGRCLRNKGYLLKGISVCEEWNNDFFAFKEWSIINGYSEELDLDRIDNSKGYSPDNCRYATKKQNSNNRDITVFVEYNSEKVLLTSLLESLGLRDKYVLIRARIRRGWSVEKSLNHPIIQTGRWKDKK